MHNMVGQLFSNDDDVISSVSKIAPLLSISMFFDSAQATLSG
jgi:Na+-driven multidrug efflux pump